jgi:hypothetical protein
LRALWPRVDIPHNHAHHLVDCRVRGETNAQVSERDCGHESDASAAVIDELHLMHSCGPSSLDYESAPGHESIRRKIDRLFGVRRRRPQRARRQGERSSGHEQD